MKIKFKDKEGILHCVEGTEEFVKEKMKEYGKEKEKIINKKLKEDKEDDSSTRRMGG